MKPIILCMMLCGGMLLRAQNPTWADDIACLVYSHCSPCHNANGSAPFPLMSYSDVVSNATYMRVKIESGEMPPWPADVHFSKLAHQRNLTDAEKASFIRWVENGKPEGNPANAPSAPVFGSSLEIPAPDLKIRIPNYTIPVITKDLYRCFVIPSGLSQQKFITGMEIIPGNRNVVHHVQVFYDTGSVCQNLDNSDPDPGYTSAGGVGSASAVLLGTWVPGSSAYFLPAGMGKKLPANASLIVQIHYPDYASGAMDSTSVHMKLTGGPVRNISDAPVLNHVSTMLNGPLFIPANTVKTFYQKYTVPLNFTVLSIGPHAHLICKSLKAFGVTPGGDTIPLIDIPEWDFHWQGFYDFKRPLKIPAGTVLHGIGVYDNTSDNHHNPSDPPKNVSAGEATTDEMMLFYFSFLPYQNGDENIVVDALDHAPHHLACESLDRSAIPEIIQQRQLTVFPNPAGESLRILADAPASYTVELYDAGGRLLQQLTSADTMSLDHLPAGVYTLRLHAPGYNRSCRFLKE